MDRRRSLLQNLRSKQKGLPVWRDQNCATNNANNKREKSASNEGVMNSGIRRRLSSLSLKIHQQLQQPISGRSSMTYLMMGRSKSMSSMGEYAGNSIRKWWEWGWDWILSRKTAFAPQDLTAAHNLLGIWRDVFYKLKSELGKLVGGGTSRLPQTTLDISAASYKP